MMARRVFACVLGGALLGLLEAVVVTAVDYRMFLSYRELGRLLASTVATGVLAVVVGGSPWWLIAARWPRLARRGYLWTALLAWPFFVGAAWVLTAGRQAAELPFRHIGVVMLGSVAALAIGGGIRLVDRSRGSASRARRVLAVFVGLAVAALLVDSVVLRRLYPVFHLSLATLACGLGVQIARLLEVRVGVLRRTWVAACIATVLLSPMALWALLDSPTARFAVEHCAPLAGKLVSRLPRVQRTEPSHTAAATTPVASRTGVGASLNLAGRDVLLITVDALRADVLRAYGGSGLTPEMDQLGQQSAVFLRAYTPTPHTSYAVTSLLTGKYMRGVMALANSEAPSDTGHATLAHMLRRYGYRTAGFYPPAIFFVDGQRFERMRREHLGFEYAKEMFASAEDRVQQLERYLQGAGGEHPVFAWVHLFEPHEPYEPPPGLAKDDSPRGRYDGEVASVDSAVGALVRIFRAKRPGATVILTADHGEEFGDHGGYHHGTSLFDEQVRVPLLWSSPGTVKPRTLALPVDTVDLVTTLLAALGIPPDARMRGDDLSPELAGDDPDPSRRAFAAIDEARMVTDGHYKAVCHHGGHCQLFDLVSDPGEMQDLSEQQPARVAALRADLTAFVASIPRVEALALGADSGWPAALARAKLGDATVAAELPPLLGAHDPRVREAAAEACGRFGVATARTVLSRLRSSDESPEVRAAAAIAGLQLGDRAALADVVELADPSRLELDAVARGQAHRAGLALAGNGDGRGVVALVDMATAATIDEVPRRRAIVALGGLRAESAVEALVAIMDEVRLRPAASEALGQIGTEEALEAVAERFSTERYPESRGAEARALVAVADPRARTLIERFLGTATSVPDGVALLQRLGGLGSETSCGADLRGARAGLSGDWQCDADGCAPGQGAAIDLRGRGSRRLVLRVDAGEGAVALSIADEQLMLRPGVQEVTVMVKPAVSSVGMVGAVRLGAFVCVPVQQDIAPPPPVPWKPDAGTAAASQR